MKKLGITLALVVSIAFLALGCTMLNLGKTATVTVKAESRSSDERQKPNGYLFNDPLGRIVFDGMNFADYKAD